jgi:hypothetical protein
VRGQLEASTLTGAWQRRQGLLTLYERFDRWVQPKPTRDLLPISHGVAPARRASALRYRQPVRRPGNGVPQPNSPAGSDAPLDDLAGRGGAHALTPSLRGARRGLPVFGLGAVVRRSIIAC